MRIRTRALPAIALAGIVMAGCSPSGIPASTTVSSGVTPGAVASPDVPAATAYDLELWNVAADGSRTADSALHLFALTYGSLPGVDVAPTSTPVRSGTPAIGAVRNHWTELSEAQRDAITQRLATPAGATQIVVPAMAATGVELALAHPGVDGPAIALAAVPPDVVQAIEGVVTDMRGRIAAKLGRPLPGNITLEVSDGPGPDGDAQPIYGDSNQTFTGGTYSGCIVRLFGPATTGEPMIITNTVAHEVFHCFEGAGAASEAAWDARLEWWVEGGAAWVGDTIGGQDFTRTADWTRWLHDPRIGLLTRSYDAEGFFAHLDEIGTSPWSVFPAIFAAPDEAARFVAAGASTDAFLDTWASGTLRDPGRGAAWDTTGPGITASAVSPEPVSIGNGDEREVAATPYSGAVFSLAASADILQVAISGHGRLSDGQIDTTNLASVAFCTKAGGCPTTCPDGTPLPQQLPPLAPASILAIDGTAAGVWGSLTGTSLEQFCRKSPSPPPSSAWIYLDKTGLRIDVASCTGPFGSYAGVLRWGSVPGTNTGYLPDPKQP
jgi:hypothetical protein